MNLTKTILQKKWKVWFDHDTPQLFDPNQITCENVETSPDIIYTKKRSGDFVVHTFILKIAKDYHY